MKKHNNYISKFIKYSVLILLIFSTTTTFAQKRKKNKDAIKWISISAKGGVGNSILLNKDVADEKNVSLDYLSLSYCYGGKLTFTYGESLGFGIEALSSKFGQKYDIKQDNFTYNKNLQLKSLDYVFFFRYSGEGGAYFELGPKFTNLKSQNLTNSIDDNFKAQDNLLDFYKKKYTSLMLGFGFSAIRTERFTMNMGLRGAYALGDLVNDHQQYILNDQVYIPQKTVNEASTNPFSLQIMLEFNYFFAFWGDASCGRGNLMFFK